MLSLGRWRVASVAEKITKGEPNSMGTWTILANGATRALAVKVGDRVLFNKYADNELNLAGEDVLIMNESDILAIIEDSNLQEKVA